MRILIGYDGSPFSQDALQDLARAGLPPRAKACILVALNPWMRSDFLSTEEAGVKAWYSAAYAQALGEAEATLERARDIGKRAADFLAGFFPNWSITVEPRLGPPDHALLDKADRWKPHLLCMGTRSHSGLKELLLGSVSQKVLHHARCSVRIGRPGIAKAGFPLRLLLAMDGSRHAEAALEAILARPWPDGSEARLAAVVDSHLLASHPWESLKGKAGKKKSGASPYGWLEKLQAKAAARLAKRGLKVTSVILEGEARDALLREAKTSRAHCLFLGSRGLSGFRRLLLGSVSSAVAAHASCSVEIIRPRAGKGA